MAASTLALWIGDKVFDHAFSNAVRRLERSRLADAKDILLRALESGAARIEDVEDLDSVAAMVFEYASAAQRGTARRNLKLLAQVFTGQVLLSPPLYADEFLRWSSVLADMSREELLLAGVAYKYQVHTAYDGISAEAGNAILIPASSFANIQNELVGAGKVFAAREELEATFFAMVRTGLLVPASGTHVMVPRVTSRLRRLVELAKIEILLDPGE